MIRGEATNTFQDGLVMDLNPLTTPNTVLTSALNATFVTFNGNEYVLQNDMGNGRVETAKLPEGYIPIGTTELGGIIYIVSYNPLIDQCQIGSFPSPERIYSGNEKDPVISKFKDGNPTVELNSENFVNKDSKEIINTRVLLQISDTTFNPGDQYIVTAYPLSENNSDNSKNCQYITDCFNGSEGPRDLRLQLITLDSNNKVIELSPIQEFKPTNTDVTGSYFLLEGELTEETTVENVENLVTNYRNIVSSAYNTFKSKVAGVMYIEADLEVLTSMNVTHKCINVNDKKYTIEFTINTEGTSFQGIEKELKYIKVLVSKNQINTSGEPEESKIVEGQRPSIDVSNLDNSKVLYFSQGKTNTITLDIDFSDSSQLSEVKFSFTPAVDFGYQTSLTRDVVIDFAKVNTGALNITYWKYLKRDNDIFVQWMLEYYPLEGRSIKQFDIKAQRLDQDVSTDTDNWELLESYSSVDAVAGNYTRTWNNLILDSIYLIQFHFQESTGEQDDTGKDIYIDRDLYKCLYTNGIFDSLFEDNEIIDFDQEYVKLDYKLNYNYSTNRSSKSYTYNQEATRLPGDEENENPFGYTAVLQDDVYQLTPAVTLENTYNTFSVDNNNTQISITDKNIYLKNFYRDLRGEGGDAWFINPDNKDNFSNIERGECIYDEQSLSNKYQISFFIDNPNPTINFSTLLFNKIRADGWNNTPTEIAIKNLWVPIQEIVPSEERQIDYNNGEETIKTEAYPYTQVIAVGINSGNSGGGPHYFLGSKNLIRDDTNNRLGISTGEAEIDENSLSPRTMDTLLYNLSNIPAGDLINKLFTVLLYVPSGDGTIRIQGVEKGEGNENHYYYFNDKDASGQTFFWWSNGDDHYNLYIPHSGGLDSSNDRDNFEKSNTVPYGIIQLLLPVSNTGNTGLQSRVIAINAFIPIKNYQYEMGTDRDTSQFKHTPYLWNLLSSFYRDVYWKTYGSRQGYKIQSYTYENNIKVDFSVKLTGDITATGPNIQFNNIPFGKLLENYKAIIDITDEKFWLPCLKIDEITSENKEFQLNISRSQNISNELITVFNASVRDTYVEPYLNNERILIPDTLTGKQAVVEYTMKEGAKVLSLFNKSVRATSWSNISNPYIEGYKIGSNGETQWITEEIQLFNNNFDLDSLSLTEDKIQVTSVPPDNYLLRFRSPGGGGEWGYSVSYKAYNIFNNFNII